MKSAAEVLKTALRNEVKGQHFYQKAAEITKDDTSRMLFLELADMDDQHALVLIERAKDAPCGKDFNPEAYLRELEATVSSRIGRKVRKVLRKGKPKKMLSLAVKMEKEARNTYRQLAAQATSDEVKKFCLELAQEEQKHANQLRQLLNSMDMDADERPGL